MRMHSFVVFFVLLDIRTGSCACTSSSEDPDPRVSMDDSIRFLNIIL
jgi:hypothetical protein